MEAFEAKAKIDIPIDDEIIKKGKKITVTKIGDNHYLWHHNGIYTLDEQYIGKKLQILTEEEIKKIKIQNNEIDGY